MPSSWGGFGWSRLDLAGDRKVFSAKRPDIGLLPRHGAPLAGGQCVVRPSDAVGSRLDGTAKAKIAEQQSWRGDQRHRPVASTYAKRSRPEAQNDRLHDQPRA